MIVRGTSPERSSRMEYAELPMMTVVPFFSGYLIYSSLARAPPAPFLLAPLQRV